MLTLQDGASANEWVERGLCYIGSKFAARLACARNANRVANGDLPGVAALSALVGLAAKLSRTEGMYGVSLVNVYTHSFFDHLIPGGTVLDLGANVGKFAALITNRYPCRCVAIEPAPNEFSQIPSNDRIEPYQLAVCDKRGEVVLNLTANSECNSLGKVPGHNYTDSVRVQAVTLDDALRLVATDRVSLLKLDIEGSEIDILGTADAALLRRFDQITVEFHDAYDMTPEPIVRDTIRKVRDAGFRVFHNYRGPNRHVDVLFVNRLSMGALRWSFEMARHWAPRIVRSAWRRTTGAQWSGA